MMCVTLYFGNVDNPTVYSFSCTDFCFDFEEGVLRLYDVGQDLFAYLNLFKMGFINMNVEVQY